MKIAIHHRENSFSDRWIAYCEKENIPFKIVNCYDSNVIAQLEDCDALMWNHYQSSYKDKLMAKQLLFSLQQAGIKVFPDFNTGWHFDDKVGQKYLLEAIGAPLVPSYVFYDKKTARKWIEKTTFPKVFKLRGGAGASNVSLVNSKSEALKLVNKAFGRGFSQFNRGGYVKERFRKYKKGDIQFSQFLKSTGRLLIPRELAKMAGREKGYVYFQEFIPSLDSDIRIQVVGSRAFGLKRFVRKNDFRASGSNNFKEFNDRSIDKELLQIAFDTARWTKSNSLTVDFIYKNNNPLIVELSYAFPTIFYDNCPGYWDSDLNWYKGKFNPQEWMVEDLVNDLKRNS